MRLIKYILITSLFISTLIAVTPVFAEQSTIETQSDGVEANASVGMWTTFGQSFLDFWSDDSAKNGAKQSTDTQTIDNEEVPTAARADDVVQGESQPMLLIAIIFLVLTMLLIASIMILYRQQHNFSNITFNLDNRMQKH